MTKGTENMCLKLGYTPEQSKLIGDIDDIFEEAVKLGLCTGNEATQIGGNVGMVFGKHTGKLMR